MTISELIARYKIHIEAYYRRHDGTPTGEADNIRDALRALRLMYGKTPDGEFGPLKLKAVREDTLTKTNDLKREGRYVPAHIENTARSSVSRLCQRRTDFLVFGS